jgi:hypothetical protein
MRACSASARAPSVGVVAPRRTLSLTSPPSAVMGLLGFFGALAAGAAVIVFGVWLYRRPVTCDGKEMSGGDTCISESGGEEVSRETYYEILQGQQDVGFFVGAVGGVIIVIAIVAPMVLGARNLRQRLIAHRSRGGVATITPRPMTVILLGVMAVIAGGVGVASNVGPVLDPVLCEGKPMDEGDYCEAT